MYGPSLSGPTSGSTLLWDEFAIGRVCFGPRCPIIQTVYVSNMLGLGLVPS